MLEQLERKLTGAILGIKINTKTFSDAEPLLKQMKGINPLLAEDYEKKLTLALAGRK